MSIFGVNASASTRIPEPPFARFSFADVRMACFWLIVRLYLGYEWLAAGCEKMTRSSINSTSCGKAVGGAWVFEPDDGAAIAGFAKHAASLSTPRAPGRPEVGGELPNELRSAECRVLLSIVTFGDVVVGIRLIVGALTGDRRLLRARDEHQRPTRGRHQHQPRPACTGAVRDHGLADRRLLQHRRYLAAIPGNAVRGTAAEAVEPTSKIEGASTA